MKLTKIRTAPEVDLEEAAGDWPISSLVQDGLLAPVYQRVFLLRLETGGAAEHVSVDDTAVLKGTFQSDELRLGLDEALSSNEAVFKPDAPYEMSLVARLIKKGNLVHVTLDAPIRIVKVQVTNDAAQSVEFYRLDGSEPAVNPTVTASVNLQVAAIASDEDFTDLRFALGFRGSDDQLVALDLAEISGIFLRSYPATPRIILSSPPDGPLENGPPPETIWIFPGRITESSLEEDEGGNVDAGEALAKGLQRYLDGLPVPLPDQIDVRLTVESDAPCLFEFAEPGPALDITYHLETQSLSSGAEKETLRFPGGRVVTREMSISLPGNATVVSARMDLAESFRRDREYLNGLTAMTFGPLTQKKGIYVGVQKWVGQKVSPETGIEASGVAIGTVALASGTEMLIELQEDWEGRPSGKKLAEGTVRIQSAGAPGWSTLLFASPVVLASRSYWLLAKATQGQAVWLADSPGTDAQVLERSGEPGVWKPVNRVEDLTMLYQLYTRTDAAQEQEPFVFMAGPEEVLPDTDGNQTGGRAGATGYDLASALNGFLGAHNGPDLVTIPLTFKSAIRGFLTAYPPRIVYDIPSQD